MFMHLPPPPPKGLAVGVEEEGQAALPGMLPELLELAEELCSDADVTVAAAAAAQLGPMVGALGARLGEGAGGVGPHLLQLACQLIQDSEDEEVRSATQLREQPPPPPPLPPRYLPADAAGR